MQSTQTALCAEDAQEARWGEPLQWTQPGGGVGFYLERQWARWRRWWLRRFRPRYVERMRTIRRGHCPECWHEVIDSRDLKFVRNVCGYWFDPSEDPHGWRDRLPVARDGWAEILLATCLLVPAGVWAYSYAPLLSVLPAALLAAVVGFFRNPSRRIPQEPGVLVAPADGRVTDVTEVEEMPMAGGRAWRIGIFLSVFDVHVNRCPERAMVEAVRYKPGRFFDARDRRAAEANEATTILFRCPELPGGRYVVRQIAGLIARRIVCYARPGAEYGRGDLLGLIKFGSRTELYVPVVPGVRVAVHVGDRVRGGTSVLVRYEAREQA